MNGESSKIDRNSSSTRTFSFGSLLSKAGASGESLFSAIMDSLKSEPEAVSSKGKNSSNNASASSFYDSKPAQGDAQEPQANSSGLVQLQAHSSQNATPDARRPQGMDEDDAKSKDDDSKSEKTDAKGDDQNLNASVQNVQDAQTSSQPVQDPGTPSGVAAAAISDEASAQEAAQTELPSENSGEDAVSAVSQAAPAADASATTPKAAASSATPGEAVSPDSKAATADETNSDSGSQQAASAAAPGQSFDASVKNAVQPAGADNSAAANAPKPSSKDEKSQPLNAQAATDALANAVQANSAATSQATTSATTSANLGAQSAAAPVQPQQDPQQAASDPSLQTLASAVQSALQQSDAPTQQTTVQQQAPTQNAAQASALPASLPNGAQTLDVSFKIQSVSYDDGSSRQQSGSQQQEPSQSGGGSQQDLLQGLLSRQSNYAAAAAKAQASSTTPSANASTLQQGLSQSALSVGQTLQAGGQAFAAKGAAAATISQETELFGAKFDNSNFAIAAGQQSGAKSVSLPGTALAQTSSAASNAEIVSAIQELIAKAPSALKGANLDGKSSFSMNLSLDGFGQLELSISRSGEAISVSMQAGSDSSKEQLANQRQDIERELKNLGYKDVSLDIGTGSNSSQNGSGLNDWRRNGSGFSNADSEDNVKLAGNALADLEEILAMK